METHPALNTVMVRGQDKDMRVDIMMPMEKAVVMVMAAEKDMALEMGMEVVMVMVKEPGKGQEVGKDLDTSGYGFEEGNGSGSCLGDGEAS